MISQAQKLYVLIRADLSPAQQAVQAGHALAQFGLDHPREFEAWQRNGNILVYLSVADRHALYYWSQAMAEGNIPASLFREGTLSVGATALAVGPNWTAQYILFKDLPLALQPKRWWNR